MESAGDAVNAVSAIVTAVAEGELTPSEAGELARVVDAYTKTLEMADFEARLRRLEGGNNSR